MSHVFGRLLVLFTLGAFALAGSAVASAGAGGRGGLRAGGVGASLAAARGGAGPLGWGGGFHGGVGRQFHGGLARPAIFSPFRTSFLRRSFVFFNVALYPSYFPYPLYPYNPAYSGPFPYQSGYDSPYVYADPAAAYPSATDAVQVYTAPAEPAAPPPRQPAVPDVPPPPADDGSVRFEVSPPEATIMLDDWYLGEAHELANREVPASAGRHLLAVRVGVEGTFTQVAVSPHKVTTVRVTLEAPAVPHPRIGRLRLQVNPPGAAIYLDGAFAAVAESAQPVFSLPPGQHRVQLVMPGYKGFGANVTVPEEGEAVVSAQLARE